MSIKHAILGFLDWRPQSGYELKKFFADALSFHWSGNNNQIYGALIELHRRGAVSVEVVQQERLPSRKVYSITELGRRELRTWALSEPELPIFRLLARTQLAWAEGLRTEEVEGFLRSYGERLAAQVLMYRETLKRAGRGPARSPREALIWRSIDQGTLAFYEQELAWVERLRSDLAALTSAGCEGEGESA